MIHKTFPMGLYGPSAVHHPKGKGQNRASELLLFELHLSFDILGNDVFQTAKG